MERPVLIDNDALLKLACYDLLGEALAALDCVPGDVRTLATAKYALLPSRNRLRLCRDEASAVRLEKFLETAKKLDVGLADPDLLDTLNAIPNIDAGEALLLAVGAMDSNALVVTGDKRSLIALCSYDNIAYVSSALTGRIISVEVLFFMLIEASDRFTYIRDCVRAKPDIDKTLKCIFGISIEADYESARQGLISYIQDLRSATGDLLYLPDLPFTNSLE